MSRQSENSGRAPNSDLTPNAHSSFAIATRCGTTECDDWFLLRMKFLRVATPTPSLPNPPDNSDPWQCQRALENLAKFEVAQHPHTDASTKARFTKDSENAIPIGRELMETFKDKAVQMLESMVREAGSLAQDYRTGIIPSDAPSRLSSIAGLQSSLEPLSMHYERMAEAEHAAEAQEARWNSPSTLGSYQG